MSRLRQIYKLHHLLIESRYPVSLLTIRAELECSRATANRVIEQLRDQFIAPIKYDRERNGYHYDLREGKIPELPAMWFSAPELYALLTAQQLLQQAQPGLLDGHLKPLRERIEKILTSDHLGGGESSGITKRVRILRMTGRNISGQHFQIIASALLQRKRLTIHYHSRGNNTESQREVSPQRLTHYRDNWYLDAWCHTRKALRSFAVERIRAAGTLGQCALDIPESKLDAHFTSSYGIFAGQPKHTAVLRFSPERARWIAEEQWHPQQQGKLLADGSYELRIPYADPRELVMDILKYGAEVEVIDPRSLRKLVHERLVLALAQYQGTNAN